jgi:hypothetical protein
VWVDRHGVGTVDAPEEAPSGRGQHRGTAVGGVDVQPDAAPATAVSDLVQRVHRARVGRARAGDDRDDVRRIHCVENRLEIGAGQRRVR